MKKNSPLARLAPLALLAASALILTGCAAGNGSTDGSSASTAAGQCGEYKSGSESKSVKVSGDHGSEVTAEFKTPFTASELQRTIVDKGDGEVTAAGQTVELHINVFAGNTGKVAISENSEFVSGDPQIFPAFIAGIDCVPVGSRVVTTVPASELFGDAGSEGLGIAGGESVVIVTDVLNIVPPLTPAEWTENPPTVQFNGDQPPVLTLPAGEPSPDLLLDVIEEGDGETVKAGDSVTVNYQGTNWGTGEIFDQSYGKQPATFATTGVVKGFGAALVGQKVGTKLVVSIPPEYGYGVAGSSSHELAGQTLVFVIEILDVASTPAQ
ncbi:FKBP-type peptidyl-prolyl cis-trans isomerase [Microterricola viridarii]|uniref:peptidylprolyl isomerase n=1 Tax=Microterricola viridarii TaxID=412690 RepID=A0A120I0S3_9MICO|nr:FKBP-type peptidyl-prolyl cis-trans isomerase [Microterricola viridarii]AMB57529.1 hypothetical protein AWU67_00140 [Microterricola viridarii]